VLHVAIYLYRVYCLYDLIKSTANIIFYAVAGLNARGCEPDT